MLALIPLAGDTEKTFVRIDRAIAKNPQLTQDIVNLVINGHVIQDEMSVIRHVYTDAKINSLLEYADETALRTVVSQRGDLGKTFRVAVKDERSVWLEEGLTEAEACAAGKTGPVGWKHIFEKHIKDYQDVNENDFAGAFDPTGSNYRSEESIQALIFTSLANGVEDPNDLGVYYYKVTDSKAMKVVVSENGYIITAHPKPVDEVPIPL